MSTIFTRIINREIPAYIVAEDDDNLAFLDINPIQKGHTLCIPKVPVDKLFDLDMEEYLSLQKFTYHVARAVEISVPCKRIGEMVLGMEVPHAHIHLIPLLSEKDLNFANPRVVMSPEEMHELAQTIRSNLAQ